MQQNYHQSVVLNLWVKTLQAGGGEIITGVRNKKKLNLLQNLHRPYIFL